MAKAICCVRGDKVSGEIMFEQKSMDAPTSITGEIRGLQEGSHGIAVCTFGDLSKGADTCGPHFNPYDKAHGAPSDESRHVGDLGNIEADEEGVAIINITDKLIALIGPMSVIGRSVVVAGKEDDLGKGGQELSLTTGNSGAAVCCGVIGLASI